MKFFCALLLLALVSPVSIQGQTQQQATPTPASDAASLFQAQSIRCEWGRERQ